MPHHPWVQTIPLLPFPVQLVWNKVKTPPPSHPVWLGHTPFPPTWPGWCQATSPFSHRVGPWPFPLGARSCPHPLCRSRLSPLPLQGCIGARLPPAPLHTVKWCPVCQIGSTGQIWPVEGLDTAHPTHWMKTLSTTALEAIRGRTQHVLDRAHFSKLQLQRGTDKLVLL